MAIPKDFKKIFFWYERSMWLGAQAYSEFNKPFNFAHLTVPWMTYLIVNGFKIGTGTFVIINIAILAIAVILGRLLEKFNVISYNQTLTNQQSRELLEILERLKKIEQILERHE